MFQLAYMTLIIHTYSGKTKIYQTIQHKTGPKDSDQAHHRKRNILLD